MSSGSRSSAAGDRYQRLARAKRRGSGHATASVQQRLRIAGQLIADSWRIAEAARASLLGAPAAPPWERFAEADARDHGELQRRLRELQAPER